MKIKLVNTSIRLGDYILQNYNQLSIFSSYLSTDIDRITEEDIEYYIEDNIKISNPLRIDLNPSLGFYYSAGKLKMHDFANEIYRGDIFDLVGLVIGQNTYSSSGFKTICTHIISTIEPDKTLNTPIIVKKAIREIVFTVRDWTSYDKYYWKLGGVDITKQKEIYPVLELFDGNNRIFNHIDDKNPCYAYYKGRSLEEKQPMYKIYIPNNTKGSKFYSNLNIPIDLRSSTGGDIIIITKSDKDRLVLKSSIERSPYLSSFIIGNLLAIRTSVANVNSESTYLNKKIIEYLYTKYSNIVLNLDFDKTGILAGYYYKKVYDINTIYIGNTFDHTKISNKEIMRLFEKIKNASDNNILFKQDFIGYIIKNKGDSDCKDFYDYSKKYGIKKLDKLIISKLKTYGSKR